MNLAQLGSAGAGGARRFVGMLSVAALLPLAATAQTNDFVQGTASSLANQLINGSNITLSGSPVLSGPASATSTFTNLDAGVLPGNLPLTLPSGVFISIGTATGTLTGDTNGGFSGGTLFQGDTDLQNLLNSKSINATVTDTTYLQFDFTVPPGRTSVNLDFIFASQENPTSNWDIAGVFVDGVNYAFMPNGAVLRVYSGANIVAYTSPNFSDWQSWSRRQTLVGLLNPNLSVHTLKIAVANTDDNEVPTGIFVANLAAGTGTTGGVGQSTGSANTAIPTLSEWGVIVLSACLALLGLGRMLRQSRQA